MIRLAKWFIVLVALGLIIWVLDFKSPQTPEEACSPVVHSTTEKTARVSARLGGILHDLKSDATAWTQTQVQEAVDGAGLFWRIQWESFRWGIKLGAANADKAVTGTGWLPPPIDCSKVCLNTGGGGDDGRDGSEGDGPPVDAIPLSLAAGGRFTAEQRSIAATAVRVGQQMGMPDRAFVVILAAGFQESGIRNLNYGDRDSLGWLQQRAGWGSAAERRDPAYAARRFYEHLRRVPGWEQLPVTVAAQKVQISAYPNAYARWEDDAHALLASIRPDVPRVPDAGPRAPEGRTPEPGGEGCSPGSGVRVGSWNIWHSNVNVNVAAGMAALSVQADVIGGQEFNDRRYLEAAKAALPGWQVVHGDTATPIFVRKAHLSIVESGKARAWPGSTPAGLPTRWVTWVTLRANRGGQTFSVVNTHLLARIERGGQLDTKGEPVRTRLAVAHLRTVGAVTGELRESGPVMVAGDFNTVPSNRAVTAEMSRAGLTPNWATLGKLDTHGTRTIDYVWSTITPGAQAVLNKYGSDHSPVVVTFPADQAAVGASAGAPAGWGTLNPRTPEQAIAYLEARIPGGIPGYPVANHCEGYMTRAYGHAGGYPTAIAHWQAGGERHPGMGVPPRGALVFWAPNHVALSLGGGRVISTDFDGSRYRRGTVAAGPISAIDRWGPRLGWRPPKFTEGA